MASSITAPQIVRWHTCPNENAFRQQAVDVVLDAARAAIHERGRFDIVLAGGGTPRRVYEALRETETDWAAWHVYFGDERCLPETDTERNSRMANEAWLSHVSIPSAQIHPIPGEAGAPIAAAVYAATLSGVGDFDLVLLGLGEDGHTASLFPGQTAGLRTNAPDAVPVFDAPKPPPSRVSLCARRLAQTRQTLFMVTGSEKLTAVRQWTAGADIPARFIRPAGGVDVFCEASLLKTSG